MKTSQQEEELAQQEPRGKPGQRGGVSLLSLPLSIPSNY
jgi:hypothetical protein